MPSRTAARTTAFVLLSAFVLAVVLLLVKLVAPPLWFTATAAAAGAVALIGLAFLVGGTPARSDFSEFAQGLASIVTIIAIFIAAGLYFLERRDRVRLAFAVEANVIQLARSGSAARQALMTVRVPVENKGAQNVTLQCIAVEIYGLGAQEGLRRNPASPEEIAMASLPGVPNAPEAPAECDRAEERRSGAAANSVRPLFRWAPLFLEPQEIDDLYLEMPVSCEFSLLRILVKLRVSPQNPIAYESKIVVPLSDVCSGRRDVRSSAVGASGSAPDRDEASPDAEAPSPANGTVP